MGCGDSTKFPCLFQVFIWPRGSSAGLRQKHIPTLVKPSRDGAQLCVWGLLLLQSPLPKVRERDYCCSKASKIRKDLFFFETVESDLTPVTFSFITLGCRKWHVLHSHWSKDLCRDTLRRVSHAAVLTWSMKVLSVHVLQVQAGQNTPFQAFSWTKAAEAQPADKTVAGHAVGLHDGGFDSNYNNGKSEGLSMFSVGDVLVCLPPSAWFLL